MHDVADEVETVWAECCGDWLAQDEAIACFGCVGYTCADHNEPHAHDCEGASDA